MAVSASAMTIDTLTTIHERRSIGKTTPEVPPRAQIEAMLDAATYAPNHHHTEPWRFSVVSGEGRVAFGEQIAAAMTARSEPEKTVEKWRTAFLRAPYVVVVTALPGKHDAETRENRDAVAAAIQNMLLAGTALGLATIWRTGALVDDPAVREFFALTPGEEIVGFVYIGYAAQTPAPWTRTPAKQFTVCVRGVKRPLPPSCGNGGRGEKRLKLPPLIEAGAAIHGAVATRQERHLRRGTTLGTDHVEQLPGRAVAVGTVAIRAVACGGRVASPVAGATRSPAARSPIEAGATGAVGESGSVVTPISRPAGAVRSPAIWSPTGIAEAATSFAGLFDLYFLAGSAARDAPRRGILQPLLGVELLLARCPCELFAAVAAG